MPINRTTSTDAALAFKGTLEEVIEGFVTKLLYTQVFAPYFKKVTEEITKSLDTDNGGDGNIIDDLERTLPLLKQSQEQYFGLLDQIKNYASSKGFDILKPTSSRSSKNPNSISQSIQGISETTANVLEGQVNAIRIGQADVANSMRQSLMFLSGIEQNTARIQRTNELLESVDKRLRELSSGPGRGLGQPG